MCDVNRTVLGQDLENSLYCKYRFGQDLEDTVNAIKRLQEKRSGRHISQLENVTGTDLTRQQ